MRQLFWAITFFIIFLSCGHKTSSIEQQTDTTKTILKDTIENKKTVPEEHVCTYENAVSDLGIGIIIAPTTFEIFVDSSLTKNFASINMYEDLNKIKFCSMFYKPDYGIMHFICIGENKNSYKVLTGFSEHKFLPKKKGYEFKAWEQYILQSLGVRRKIDISPKQILRGEPNETSKELKIPGGLESFCPMKINGDWIKVKYDCFYNSENHEYEGQPCSNYIDKCDESLTGWIKWRNKNELLIDIFLIL